VITLHHHPIPSVPGGVWWAAVTLPWVVIKTPSTPNKETAIDQAETALVKEWTR